ncbi:glycerophosphodiester phosphodiesterase [Couchioplanes caeruleus]|uniref:glycerophosphodiester phosphodiesterase n=1 Tax=Couchioplanes caeruleus TaxID=56438 RepID=UPI0020C02E17|nr:glycerophosphodiester phosphodiesterase [Couchioplanes caeruleus]UQU66532.1 glycerophosphodiester phosphodiesterase [Couchioplanes caeruleus]
MADHRMLVVAHRAGNTVDGLRAALASNADLVEADVHLYRGALEMRHSRTLGPRLYWDRSSGVTRRRDVVVPELEEILAVADGDPRLLLDLKGRSLAVAARVAETLRARRPGVPVAVCTKEWPMLDAFAGDANVRRILSVANAVQLARLRARLRGERVDGVSIRLRLLTASVVAELRRATDLVLAWPVDSPAALARAERLGVTGVVTKNV